MFTGIMDFCKRVLKNEKGQGMVEYILIVLLIALVAFVGFGTLGGKVNEKAGTAAGKLESATSTNCLYMIR